MRRIGRELLYVVENGKSFEYRSFASGLSTQPIGLAELSAKHLQNDPDIVIDIDLRRAGALTKLQRLLSARGTGCRIFLVDTAVAGVLTNARKMGADTILSVRSGPETILAALRDHHGVSVDPSVAKSIEAGVDAVEEGFCSLIAEQAFDTVGVEAVSGEIADAISNAGIEDWIATVRGYHVGTFQHCMLVTATASDFARRIGMGRGDVVKITAAALVHDIGKAAIPLTILDKPSALDPIELNVMRGHPTIGHSYLARRSRIAAETLQCVRSHHEYLDGSGYPDQIGGSDIGDLTRIITICDIYAAMTERRAYKPPKSALEACEMLSSLSAAGKLEKALVRAFVSSQPA